MAMKPSNMSWGPGYTDEQRSLLDFIDFVGNNGWDRNGQTDELMPNLLADCEAANLTLAQITAAMMSIGYDKQTVHELERWESKRTTGRLDPPRPKRR